MEEVILRADDDETKTISIEKFFHSGKKYKVDDKTTKSALIQRWRRDLNRNFESNIVAMRQLLKQKTDKSLTRTVGEGDNKETITLTMPDITKAFSIYKKYNNLLTTQQHKIKILKRVTFLRVMDEFIRFVINSKLHTQFLDMIKPMLQEKVFTKQLFDKFFYFYIAEHKLRTTGSFFKMDQNFRDCFEKILKEIVREKEEKQQNLHEKKSGNLLVDFKKGMCSSIMLFSLYGKLSTTFQVLTDDDREEFDRFTKLLKEPSDRCLMYMNARKQVKSKDSNPPKEESVEVAPPRPASPKRKSHSPTPAPSSAPPKVETPPEKPSSRKKVVGSPAPVRKTKEKS